MNADVLAFACRDIGATPDGLPVICERQRWHGGDHRGTRLGSNGMPNMIEWPDPPTPQETPMAFGDQHDNTGHVVASFDQPVQLEGRVVSGFNGAWMRGMLTLAFIVALACAPAVVIAVWEALL